MGTHGPGWRPQGSCGLTGEAPQHSQFYGRRTTRPPRPQRAAALEAGLPRYEITLPLPPLFPDARETWLEIGFGSGEHLLVQARHHPDIGIIGCEPFMNGVSALMKDLQATPLDNIRIFTEDARFLLKALPDRSIARCFVLFADPWPKKRHNKRRIVNTDTLDDLARVLMPGGRLYLATDHDDLAAWYRSLITAHPAFVFDKDGDPGQKPNDWPATRYEEKALMKGRQPIYSVACCK